MDVREMPSPVRESLDTLASGDMDGFVDVWSDDVVWRIGGTSAIAGVHRGKDAIRGVITKTFELCPTYSMEPVDVLADDTHAVLMFHATGERDGKTLDTTVATFVTVEGGKLTSCWWLPSDHKQYDAFWS